MNKDFDIKQLYLMLVKHLYSFLAVMLTIIVITLIYIYRAPKIYQATVVMEIEPKSSNILGRGIEVIGAGNTGYYWANKEYSATQYEIMKSRAVSAKAIENISHMNLRKIFSIPENKDGNIPEKKNIDFIGLLQSKIQVNPQKNSNIVRVSIVDQKPETASFLANQLASAYIEFNMEKRYVLSRDAAKWLSEQSINLKQQLEESELTLFNFKKGNEILATTFEDRQQMLATKILNINQRLTDREIYLKKLQAKIGELSKINVDEEDWLVSGKWLITSPILENQKAEYLKVKSKLQEKLFVYGDKHPEILVLRNEEKNIRKALADEISSYLERLNIENNTTIEEIKKLRQMLYEVQTEAIKLNKLEIQFNKLKRDVETNKQLYDIVLERTKQADLSALLKANNIGIIDKALVPKGPIKPRKKIIFIVGLFIAFISSALLIFILEFFDTKIGDLEELENIIGRNVLGIFPKFTVPEEATIKELAFEDSHHSSAVEALRTIRTNIKLAHPDMEANSLLITSSASQEGKTTVSANIAVSFSMSGRSVLLIDTDMRKPRVHKLFGIENKTGISTYMIGDKNLDDVIISDIYKGVDLLLCGPIPPNPAEMIESIKFRNMVEQLKEKYDLIIFDSPPIVAVSDSSILSTMVDGVILVVKIRQVSRDVLKRAIIQIKKSTGKIIGSVVNNVDLKTGSRYGQYYYYYHNKYYGESEEDKKS